MQSKPIESINDATSLSEQLDRISACEFVEDSGGGTGRERRQLEALLLSVLNASNGNFAFVLSPAGTGAYAEQFVKLGAAMERHSNGNVQPCRDSLNNRRPDPMILSVMRLRLELHGKPTDIGMPLCLPGSHPPIHYFLMVPLEIGATSTSVLFVANPQQVGSDNMSSELIAHIKKLCDVLSARKRDTRKQVSTCDELTGLVNRFSFLNRLQLRLNTPETRIKTALLHLDLDGFKVINDTLGHDCGDELLRKVARRLELTVTPADICARLSADEFTVILTSTTDVLQICKIAESIVNSFRKAFEIYGHELHLSTSIGIALADAQTSSCDAFIKQADTALYKAKSSGRSRWMVYTREFQSEQVQRSALEARVRRATARQEFTLVYQPQFRIDNESIVSFEALLRWAPTDIKAPNTQQLITILEGNGLINEVGQWVLETACQQFVQWRDLGLLDEQCTMSVNVSAAQLNQSCFTTRLRRILERCEMPADKLNLEITESALIEKNSNCIPVINCIKDMGVQLSLDDFGTGYASLSYLTRLPVDFLKIDKSFVMAMGSDESSRAIVMSVLAMAGTLDIEVVAEGIENAGTLQQLREAKCKFGQGFLVSRPVCAENLEPLLVRNNFKREEVMALG